jgi:hypothetical protein
MSIFRLRAHRAVSHSTICLSAQSPFCHLRALYPPPHITKKGEKSLGISHLRSCEGKSYSGPLIVYPDILVRANHCNCRQPILPQVDQDVIYMKTCTPLYAPEDLKVLIREGLTKICPPDFVKPSYNMLRFFLSPGNSGTQGLHLLVGL